MNDQDKAVTEEEVAYDIWEAYAEDQLKTIFDAFLPLSVGGGIRIEYTRAIKERYEDGTVKTDPTKAVGVKVYVELDFGGPVNIGEENTDG